MRCPYCGSEVPSGGSFCPQCGCAAKGRNSDVIKKATIAAIAGVLLLVAVVFIFVVASKAFSEPSLEGEWSLNAQGTSGGVTQQYPSVTLVVKDGCFNMDVVGATGGMKLFGLTGSDRIDISATGSCVLEQEVGDSLVYALAFDEICANDSMRSYLRTQYGMTEPSINALIAQMNKFADQLNSYSIKLKVPKSGVEMPIGEGVWGIELNSQEAGYEVLSASLSGSPAADGWKEACFSMEFEDLGDEQASESQLEGTWRQVGNSSIEVQYDNPAGGSLITTSLSIAFTPV